MKLTLGSTKFVPQIAMIVVVLTGCSGLIGGGGLDGPVISHSGRPSLDGQDAEVRGVLQLDEDCLYLAPADIDERYPVIWPRGTRWNPALQAVSLPNGQTVQIGEEVAGGGGYPDIGDVERLSGVDSAALARRASTTRSERSPRSTTVQPL